MSKNESFIGLILGFVLYVIKWLKNQTRKPAFVNGLSCFSCLRGKQVLPVNPLMAFSVHSFFLFETEEDGEDWSVISHTGKICFEVQFFKRFFKVYIPSINKELICNVKTTYFEFEKPLLNILFQGLCKNWFLTYIIY